MIDVEKYYREQNLKGFIKECSSIKLYPICIPTYKNRKIADFLNLCLEKEQEEEIFLFIYEDDFIESKYDEYIFPKNVKPVIITKEDFQKRNIRWRGIQPKRKYIQEYMNEIGIDKYFVIDDDIKEFGIYSGEERKNNCKSRYVEKVYIYDLLKCIQVIFDYYNAAICSSSLTDLDIQFFKFNRIVKPWLCCGCVLINGKLLNNNNIFYTDKNIHEDHKLFIDCIKSNLLSIAVCGFSHKANDKLESSTYNRLDLNINDFLELYPLVKMKYNKKDKFYFTSLKIFDILKYGLFNIQESEEDLYIRQLCLNNDKESIIKYFEEKKK